MKKNGEIIRFAAQIIDNEANAISNLKARLDDDFAEVVELILENKGNLVFSGIGKSALIAQKIAEIFDVPVREVMEQTSRNIYSIFKKLPANL